MKLLKDDMSINFIILSSLFILALVLRLLFVFSPHGVIMTPDGALYSNKLPFNENSFDFVIMLAVLEHLDHPAEIVREIERVLKPKGKLILTVPSRYSKPVLEFLAYKLKIVNEEEINNHKKYYNYKDLEKLFEETDKLKIQEHKYFQFYMNNFCIVQKEIT